MNSSQLVCSVPVGLLARGGRSSSCARQESPLPRDRCFPPPCARPAVVLPDLRVPEFVVRQSGNGWVEEIAAALVHIVPLEPPAVSSPSADPVWNRVG